MVNRNPQQIQEKIRPILERQLDVIELMAELPEQIFPPAEIDDDATPFRRDTQIVSDSASPNGRFHSAPSTARSSLTSNRRIDQKIDCAPSPSDDNTPGAAHGDVDDAEAPHESVLTWKMGKLRPPKSEIGAADIKTDDESTDSRAGEMSLRDDIPMGESRVTWHPHRRASTSQPGGGSYSRRPVFDAVSPPSLSVLQGASPGRTVPGNNDAANDETNDVVNDAAVVDNRRILPDRDLNTCPGRIPWGGGNSATSSAVDALSPVPSPRSVFTRSSESDAFLRSIPSRVEEESLGIPTSNTDAPSSGPGRNVFDQDDFEEQLADLLEQAALEAGVDLS